MGRKQTVIRLAALTAVKKDPLGWASDQTDRAMTRLPKGTPRDDVFEAVVAARSSLFETNARRLLERLRGLLAKHPAHKRRPPRR